MLKWTFDQVVGRLVVLFVRQLPRLEAFFDARWPSRSPRGFVYPEGSGKVWRLSAKWDVYLQKGGVAVFGAKDALQLAICHREISLVVDGRRFLPGFEWAGRDEDGLPAVGFKVTGAKRSWALALMRRGEDAAK